MKVYIGTYYKTEKKAIEGILEKKKRFKKEFIAMEFSNGYLVLPESEIKQYLSEVKK
jgi:hypothetical protein